ncbi:hypothetical protein OPV22_002491 [Ensete ventricosum]|uniref:Uncharacterized protein n=1 Tax=Ensete ventricosum TaxID=4639 RepID=A0AAV8RY06_ENSVE|nr:hypothetical protein OPV22_002491 [Ensete ventricosum]
MPAAGIALAPGLCKSALGDGTPTRNACCRHCARAWIMQICTWRRDAHSQCLLQKRSRLNSANLHLKRSRLKSANLHCATAAAALLIWGDGRPLTRKRLLVLNLRRCCCALAPAIAACALASQIAAGHSHSEHASVSNKNKQPASQSSTGGGHIANERMSLCNLAFTEGSCFGGDESVRRRAGSQWIVAARPLYHLQCPIAYLSRLQRIRPVVRAEFHFPMVTRGRTTTGATPATRAHGGRRPLLSESTVRRPGKAPEGAVPGPSPGRHAATRSRRESSSSSPPTADGFGAGTPVPSPQSQSFSRSYGSVLPTSLAYIVPWARGCSPWRPDAVISTAGRGRHSVLRIFKGRRGRTGRRATCGALPTAGPYLRLSRFQGGRAVKQKR